MKEQMSINLKSKLLYLILGGVIIFGNMTWLCRTIEADDSIRLNFSVVPDTMDPTCCWLVEHLLIVQATSQSLVRIDQTGALVGDITEKWEVDNDNKTYTFFISKNAKFHDGTSVTAIDVARSISSHFKKGSASIVSHYLLNAFPKPRFNGDILCNIELVDDLVFKIHLKNAFPPFLYALSMGNFSVYKKKDGKIILSGPMEPDFDKTARTWYLTSRTNGKRIIIKEVQNYEEAIKSLMEKKVDALIGYPIKEAIKLIGNKRISITKTASLATCHFYFNINKAPFNDINFREDLNSLIQNYTKRYNTPYTRYEPYFIPKGIMPADYYRKSHHDFLTPEQFRKKRPDPTEINIVINETAFPDAFIHNLEPYLKTAGIKARLETIGNNALFQHLKTKDYDLIGGRFMGGFADPAGFLNSISDNLPVRYGTFPTDELLGESFTLKDYGSRKRLDYYAKLLNKFEKNYYVIPLYRLYLPIIHQNNLKIPSSDFRFMLEIWRITY